MLYSFPGLSPVDLPINPVEHWNFNRGILTSSSSPSPEVTATGTSGIKGRSFHLERICSRGSLKHKKKRIDMMFDQKAVESVKRNKEGSISSICSTSSINSLTSTSTSNWASFQVDVDYMGSVPIRSGKGGALKTLQKPLKELYLTYRKNNYYSNNKCGKVGGHSLVISEAGLKVKVKESNERDSEDEWLTPFSSIAVWAAMKFVCRPQEDGDAEVIGDRPTNINGRPLKYAFLPIVTKTENPSLFRTLDRKDLSYALEKTYDDHSPLFVVTMRGKTPEAGLECHCFACPTSEDAIMLAANLYEALLSVDKADIKCPIEGHLDRENLFKRENTPPRRPPRRKRKVAKESKEGIGRLNNSRPESGDVFTKVIMPGSQSFISSPGLGNGVSARPRPCSPLGLIELFNELRINEGLSGIDEILNTIINVDGMSFNGLKPIYKEFVLKLALTLTKDELYQRSKYVMRKQKKRQKARRRHNSCGVSLKIRKAVANIRPKVRLPKSYLVSTLKKKLKHRLKRKLRKNGGCRGLINHITTRRTATLTSANHNNNLCADCNSPTSTPNRCSKCYCYCYCYSYRSIRKCRNDPIKCSTSGSTCSCDTDSCVQSDKCYCSRYSNNNKRLSIFEQLKEQGFAASESSLSPPNSNSNSPNGTVAERGLESTTKHSKKYLQASKSLEFFHVGTPPNVHETNSNDRLQPCPDENGNNNSGSNSDAETCQKIRSGNKADHHHHRNRNSRIKDEDYYERREEAGFVSNSSDNCQRTKILVVSARDRNGQVKNSLFTPFCQINDLSPYKRILKRCPINSDAVSIKKAAEIAALFSSIKKSNCTNSKNDTPYSVLNSTRTAHRNGGTSLRGSTFETSLGYFP